MTFERQMHFHKRAAFLNARDDDLPKLLHQIEHLCSANSDRLDDYMESPFCGLHPEAVRMVVRNDDYYLGIRANHFVLVFGQTEALNKNDSWEDCVVCIANHKGGICINTFLFSEEAWLPKKPTKSEVSE